MQALADSANLTRVSVLLVNDNEELREHDIVLTDLGMNGIGGGLLAHVLSATHPRLPIVFMTAVADLNAARAEIPVGARMLRKPLLIEDLVSAIESALAGELGQR